MLQQNALTLATLRLGQSAILCAPSTDSEAVLRLSEMGMTQGTLVTLIRKGPLGTPLQISLRGTRLCLRTKEASLFSVILPK